MAAPQRLALFFAGKRTCGPKPQAHVLPPPPASGSFAHAIRSGGLFNQTTRYMGFGPLNDSGTTGAASIGTRHQKEKTSFHMHTTGSDADGALARGGGGTLA